MYLISRVLHEQTTTCLQAITPVVEKRLYLNLPTNCLFLMSGRCYVQDHQPLTWTQSFAAGIKYKVLLFISKPYHARKRILNYLGFEFVPLVQENLPNQFCISAGYFWRVGNKSPLPQ